MRRTTRAGLVLAGAVSALFAADTAAWWWATSRMESEFAAWKDARTAEGYAVRTGPAERAGWPLEADLILSRVTLATGDPGQPGTAAWQAEQVRLSYAPWHPQTLDVTAFGPQSVQVAGAAPLDLTVEPLDLHIPLTEAGAAQGVLLSARSATVSLPNGPLRIGRLSVRFRPADAFISADAVAPPGQSLPFGGTVQSIDAHARITAPLPPVRDVSAALAAWRDSGQRLLLDGVAVHWGPLDLRGHAALGLDRALQPEGSAEVRMTGYAEAIDALARAGAITRSDARVATTLLSLVARPGTGEGAEADLPLTLKDRTLSVGAIPLLRLPVLALP